LSLHVIATVSAQQLPPSPYNFIPFKLILTQKIYHYCFRLSIKNKKAVQVLKISKQQRQEGKINL